LQARLPVKFVSSLVVHVQYLMAEQRNLAISL
jgi:hypothetical protein